MQRSCRQFCYQRESASSWLPVVSLLAGLTLFAGLQEAHAQGEEPFKFMNIHFETNASGCDMGIQILFDTDGVTELSIEDPNGDAVFNSQTPAGMEDTHDLTEGFQERVEPPITELEDALVRGRPPGPVLRRQAPKLPPRRRGRTGQGIRLSRVRVGCAQAPRSWTHKRELGQRRGADVGFRANTGRSVDPRWMSAHSQKRTFVAPVAPRYPYSLSLALRCRLASVLCKMRKGRLLGL